jgi:hypothetical protein
MGSLSTVSQAEVMAILGCTELLLSKNITSTRIHICYDSRAAIAALVKTTTDLSLVWESMQLLEKLIESNKVTLVQIPGHQGIPGNEEADKLAQEGTNGVPSDHTADIPCIMDKEVIRSHLRVEHLDRWTTCKGCHQSKTLMSELRPSRTKELQAMIRQKLRVSVGLLTGCTTLRAQTFKLGLTQWQDC